MTGIHSSRFAGEQVTSATADRSLALLVDEFSRRLEKGERIDVEAFIAKHPEHAERLERLIPSLLALAELGASGPRPAGTFNAPLGADQPGVLGDFRLIREVGRGGMGVVYEAEQISLGRRVALKVLPFAAVLDERQLARFKNEARAAATLHHTNIVPVFSVGCERGVHFYAMQFIEGHTLADVIAELRKGSGIGGQGSGKRQGENAAGDATCEFTPNSLTPDPRPLTPAPDTLHDAAATIVSERSTNSPAFYRTIAKLGIQAAEALEHAHQHGVIHRDIKPANLMLDASGNLWIADFGLARLEADSGMTMTGDLIGTLRYMSPEQALGKRVAIDHRTDVYSLGATLYELLAFRPPFDGEDRGELLRQVAFEEPRPLKRHSRAIPVELETIVLKSLSKNPADRYESAQELADDLWRFLEDKPLLARRPSLVTRARKWTRRHQTLMWSGTAALGVAIATIIVAFVSVQSTNDVAEETISQERRKARKATETAQEQVATHVEQAAKKREREDSDGAELLFNRIRFEVYENEFEQIDRLAERYGDQWNFWLRVFTQLTNFYFAECGNRIERKHHPDFAELIERRLIYVTGKMAGTNVPRNHGDYYHAHAKVQLSRRLIAREEYDEASLLLSEAIAFFADESPIALADTLGPPEK